MSPDVMARLPLGARVRHLKSHISYVVVRRSKAGVPLFRHWGMRGPELRMNPANLEFDAGYDAAEARANLAKEAVDTVAKKMIALQDVADLIWPPSYHLTEDGDLARRQQSEVLAAIMDRLAFMRPAVTR